jgi:hypothetical protein
VTLPTRDPRLLLLPILLVAALLRLPLIGGAHFYGSDGLGVAWPVALFYPRGLSSFARGDVSLDPNPLSIITLSHGPLQVMAGILWASLLSWLHIPLTELAWDLPFALIGVSAVVVAYALVATLKSQRAGLIAAALVAVLPLHATFSRTSGESHFILASLLQMISIMLFWKALETGRRRWYWGTGVALALDMLTDFGFLCLLVVLVWACIVFNHEHSRPSVFRTLTVSRASGLLVPLTPSLVVSLYNLHSASGLYGRAMISMHRQCLQLVDSSGTKQWETSSTLPMWLHYVLSSSYF